MLNLFDYLTPLDNKRLENYITTYGANKDFYKGNQEYLKDWAASKKKMFHVLGGNLIVKVPYTYEKRKEEVYDDISTLLYMPFFNGGNFERLVLDNIRIKLKEKYPNFEEPYYSECSEEERFPSRIIYLIGNIFTTRILYENAIDYCYRFGTEISESLTFDIYPEKKKFTIQKGMKPLRALKKILEYFDLFDEMKDFYEKFRIKLSMIFNDKVIKGNLCFSIHPLDFLTMSDNDSNWRSCMSWVHDGCYKIGSVETMNSNNTICCYFENSRPFNFSIDKEEQTEDWIWNNKKWRILFYVTKDIILSGKSYPYYNEDLTKSALEKLRELAKVNAGLEYHYGIEQYKDMIHVNGLYLMEKNKYWLAMGKSTKYNILFDTKGMYNDMLNANTYHYWCVRNKVKKMKIISCSGKAPCLCCSNQVIEDNIDYVYEDYDDELDAYNNRYTGVGSLICKDCKREYTCSQCDALDKNGIHIDDCYYCKECFKKYSFTCPICGEEHFEYHKHRYVTNDMFNSLPKCDEYYDFIKKNALKEKYFKICSKCNNNIKLYKAHDDNYWFDLKLYPAVVEKGGDLEQKLLKSVEKDN